MSKVYYKVDITLVLYTAKISNVDRVMFVSLILITNMACHRVMCDRTLSSSPTHLVIDLKETKW